MASVTFLGSAVSIAAPAAVAVKDLKSSATSSQASAPQKAFIVEASNEQKDSTRRNVLKLAAAAFAATAFTGRANAGLVDDLLAKSAQNKALNDAKRLATSGANSSRPWTVQLGSCRFPDNFTGCDDLARNKRVAFISDDLDLECEGKEPGKCASNNLWNAKTTGNLPKGKSG